MCAGLYKDAFPGLFGFLLLHLLLLTTTRLDVLTPDYEVLIASPQSRALTTITLLRPGIRISLDVRWNLCYLPMAVRLSGRTLATASYLLLGVLAQVQGQVSPGRVVIRPNQGQDWKNCAGCAGLRV